MSINGMNRTSRLRWLVKILLDENDTLRERLAASKKARKSREVCPVCKASWPT